MSARLRNLNPYELHKYLVNVYCLNAKGSTGLLKRDTSKDRTDLDVIRENHKFLWEEDDVADSWEKQLAKKYYDKLFKEYCICDLTRYKENKVSCTFLLPILGTNRRKFEIRPAASPFYYLGTYLDKTTTYVLTYDK